MKKSLIFTFLFLVSFISYSQELNCTVSINYDRVTNVNPQIFNTLKTQITEFMNNTKWTAQEVEKNEKIDCTIFLNIASFNSNDFSGSIQVQSSRPIFNSNYSSPILNVNDNNVGFRYIEYENFVYDPNSFNSNLISILSFYAHVIIGLDADTFEDMGGSKYLETASLIANLAQSGGYAGWNQSDSKNNNRYFLISDLLSSTFSPYRKALYTYHMKGLDVMSDKTKEGKEQILNAINTLAQIQKTRPNALITRTFFDAKADEIVSLFTGGPAVSVASLVETLNRISPLNSAKWNNIR